MNRYGDLEANEKRRKPWEERGYRYGYWWDGSGLWSRLDPESPEAMQGPSRKKITADDEIGDRWFDDAYRYYRDNVEGEPEPQIVDGVYVDD